MKLDLLIYILIVTSLHKNSSIGRAVFWGGGKGHHFLSLYYTTSPLPLDFFFAHADFFLFSPNAEPGLKLSFVQSKYWANRFVYCIYLGSFQ